MADPLDLDAWHVCPDCGGPLDVEHVTRARGGWDAGWVWRCVDGRCGHEQIKPMEHPPTWRHLPGAGPLVAEIERLTARVLFVSQERAGGV